MNNCNTTDADTGGTWTGPGVFGTLTGDNPQIDTANGTPGQTYTFTYSGGVAPCDDTSNLTLTIREAPDAGTSTTTNVCESDSTFNIFNQLAGTPDTTGVWSGDTGNAGYSAGANPPTTATFNPSTSGVGTFTFTYTVSDVVPSAPVCNLGSCPDDTATITINVTAGFEAGSGASISVCG